MLAELLSTEKQQSNWDQKEKGSTKFQHTNDSSVQDRALLPWPYIVSFSLSPVSGSCAVFALLYSLLPVAMFFIIEAKFDDGS